MRTAEIKRQTNETDIFLRLNLDGKGEYRIKSGIGFMDHCLSQWAKHGAFDLEIKAEGDLKVDAHHTVEDIGICLGQAIKEASRLDFQLVSKAGSEGRSSACPKSGLSEEIEGPKSKDLVYRRFGQALIPMDEALAMVAVDLSGRSYLAYEANINPRVGDFDTELVEEFLRAVTAKGEFTLHVRLLAGHNTHHCLEAIFKALGRAMREALSQEEQIQGVPSTKGVL
ncbi:MAG: imidazoleglycerol-phosphate dehydratase HisB [Peptococcaceae bacterium]